MVKQVQGSYQAKHLRLRLYRNLVLDLLEGFKEHQLTIIPRKENVAVDALAVSASLFQDPKHPNEQYQIEVRNRASILDNVDHWKVFEDDKQINRFLQMYGEFENLKINQENIFEKNESSAPPPD